MKAPSLLTALSLLSVTLGVAPTAHAATTDPSGVIDFSVPSAPTPPPPPTPVPPAPTDSTPPAQTATASTPPPDSTTTALNSTPVLNFPSSSSSTPSPPTPPLSPSPSSPSPPSSPPSPSPSPQTPPSPSDLFSGGSNSLVARTIGHAEGTRTAEGGKTRAFYGHTDPGNGVWNLGSFSFQHCRDAAYRCSTPEEADDRQLRRLHNQAQQLQSRADALGLSLSVEEALNGIDLANQAPLAALGEPGYPEWLKKAREKGLSDQEAILWARVSSYWDTNRKRWAAPGLGNTEAGITHDQNRRMTAIARALDNYNQQVARKAEPSQQAKVETNPEREQRADRIIAQNLTRN